MPETDEETPIICQNVIEFTILHSRAPFWNGAVYPRSLIVEIGHDGSVYAHWKDGSSYEKPALVAAGTFHTWKEFKAFDTLAFSPAAMIEQWLTTKGITVPWINGNDDPTPDQTNNSNDSTVTDPDFLEIS